MSGELVLVTGGSGFVGAHCIVRLLQDGYRVRTTIRSLSRESVVRSMIKVGGVAVGVKPAFAVADLTADAGWAEAMAGCDYVLHVASPFLPTDPQHEDDLIIPAREGTLRVLRTAQDAGVKRVVMTSSFIAVGYGHKPTDQPFTEETWTDLTGGVTAYAKSKTLAERAAWDFIEREGGTLELAVINPTGIFGPVLGSDFSGSIQLVKQLMDGAMAGIPRLSVNIVDVRDVADLHVRAMTNPAAKGERFIATAGNMLYPQIANVLRERMGGAASRIPTRIIPNWLLRALATFMPVAKQVVPDLGNLRLGSSEKAKRVLGWQPRSTEDAIIATAESFVRLKLLRNSTDDE